MSHNRTEARQIPLNLGAGYHILQNAELSESERQYRYLIWRNHFFSERLRISLVLAVLAHGTFLLLGIFAPSDHLTHQGDGWVGMATLVELGLLCLLSLICSPLGKRHSAAIFLGATWLVTLSEQVWSTLQGFALFGIVSWTLVFLTLTALIPVRWKLHLIAQLGIFSYFWGVNWYLSLPQREPPYVNTLYLLYLFWFCAICNLSIFLYERLQRSEYDYRINLQIEKHRSEQLLLNLLPPQVAEQLKAGRGPIADNFPDVTVLFADLVGFTEISSEITPVELVVTLNQIFSAFDRLVVNHSLEKIKTIGDSYMAVGGVPSPRPDHAEAIADLALEMRRCVVRFNQVNEQSFQLRIGIHTGPVVAGVIGKKRAIYDLWGDTVNIASHMESHGIPDAIQVSEKSYERLKDTFAFSERGMTQIKGKGQMKTFLLLGRRAEAQNA